MFCTNCGTSIDPQAKTCPSCGAHSLRAKKHCYSCGAAIQADQTVCPNCGVSLECITDKAKSKLTAGLLAIFLGALGIHKFYLGYITAGVIMLVVSIVGAFLTSGIATGVVAIIAIIEAIIYLTKSDEGFAETYVIGRKTWF